MPPAIRSPRASRTRPPGRPPRPRLTSGTNDDRLSCLFQRSCRTSCFHGLTGERFFRGFFTAELRSLRGRTMQLRGEVHSLADPLICAAAADIALQGIVNLRVAWLRILSQKRRGRHDLSRLAIAAL